MFWFAICQFFINWLSVKYGSNGSLLFYAAIDLFKSCFHMGDEDDLHASSVYETEVWLVVAWFTLLKHTTNNLRSSSFFLPSWHTMVVGSSERSRVSSSSKYSEGWEEQLITRTIGQETCMKTYSSSARNQNRLEFYRTKTLWNVPKFGY